MVFAVCEFKIRNRSIYENLIDECEWQVKYGSEQPPVLFVCLPFFLFVSLSLFSLSQE